MKVSKILKFIGIGFGGLVVVTVAYVYITDTRPSSAEAKKTSIEITTAQKTVNVKTNELELRKTTTRPIAKKDQTVASTVPVMPKLNIVKPDQEIEKIGIKVSAEKKGIPAQPECYRIVANILEKAIKSINCINGFIVFNSEEAMSGVEVMLAINKYEGVDYYSLADEKGSVEFKYAVVEGDLNGQTRKTTKIFALGMIGSSTTSEYVILECPDVLASRLSDGIRTICLSPVIAGIGSREVARKVLEDQCYLHKASLQLLVPQIEVSQLK